MINKIKNMTGKIIILALMMIMVMPIGVFAETSTIWDKYREEVKKGIKAQQISIKIDFTGSEYVGTETLARIIITEEYEKAKSELPNYMVELNIESASETTVPELNGTSLKSVTHTIGYKNNKQDFDKVRTHLDIEYQKIKTKTTDYDKLKFAYDYVVIELGKTENPEIKNILDKQNAHAVLFAMMMTDMGYDNDIANSIEESTVNWNLVKVQGQWYHVDVRTGDFLIFRNQDIKWNEDKHEGKVFAKVSYNEDTRTTQQLIYEIGLIIEDVNKTSNESNKISTEEVLIEQIVAVKKELEIISTKIKNFEDIKEVLATKISTEVLLVEEYNKLVSSITNLFKKIEIKERKINEIELGIEAVKRAEQNLIENNGRLDSVLKTEVDIALKVISSKSKVYNELEEQFNKVLNFSNAKIHLNNAESKLKDYVAVDTGVKYAYYEAIKAKNLIDPILDSKYSGIIKGFNIIITNIDRINLAKDKVMEAQEASNTKLKNDEAKKYINLIDIKYDKPRKDLNLIITALEEALIKEEVNIIIAKVKDAEDVINAIPKQGPLKDIISTAEANIKIADAEVKKIKDTGVRTTQQNRIKDIKLVISAIKAVNKAETAVPLSATNVKSARTAISKVSEQKFETIIENLEDRLDTIESKIITADNVTKAEKAVEKAEKSMKDIDIAGAKVAVGLLSVDATLIDTEGKLKKRIDATEKVVKLEASLEIYLKESFEINGTNLKTNIEEAESAIEELENGIIRNLHTSRMTVIKNIKIAIEAVEKVNVNHTTETVKTAEDNIANVTDSKVKKELEKKLKDIIVQKNIASNINDANKAVENAKTSLEIENSTSVQNVDVVKKAEAAVKILPTGTIKKNLEAIIKELNDAIKAKQTVENAESKSLNNTLASKDVIAAEKVILNINLDYKKGLDSRVEKLRTALEFNEAAELLKKAIDAIEKAKETELAKDITTAKKAVSLVKDGDQKEALTKDIEDLEVTIATKAVKNAEVSMEFNIKSISKDITTAKNTVEAISSKEDYEVAKANLHARIKTIESYVAAIKVLDNAEKTVNVQNINAADKALANFDAVLEKVGAIVPSVYAKMRKDIQDRILIIKTFLEGEEQNATNAENAVIAAEKAMTVKENSTNYLIEIAQKAVNMVTDKTLKSGLQKRIDDIHIVKDAKLAVIKATVYPNEKGVKDAETALDKINGRYSDIIEDLSSKIAELKNQLNISKRVAEAANLVQKAVESRKQNDITIARDAVDGIKDLDNKGDTNNPYQSLKDRLDALENSIEKEEAGETTVLETAKEELAEALIVIDDVNTDIAKITEGDSEAGDIKKAYAKIQVSKNHIIASNAAIRRLIDQKQQKDLLKEIDFANKEIELSEDNIDVKEAVRLVTIASSSVSNAKEENQKSKAKLDIAAARRAVDKIGHNDNKAIKVTILNTINSIEKKLTSDNDQELIDAAVDAVNTAAEILASAVKENKVVEKQEEIDKAIFAAKLAIGWISDNNKAAKDTLTGFVNDIAAMFESEKDGIANEERIKNAEKAVVLAESKKGKDELEGFIRSARLRVKMIKNDGPESETKIMDLNTRLDVLEGKTDGSSGTGGGSKPDGNSGSNKPGGSDTTTGNKVPTTPLPNSDRFIGTTKPIWGKTNELNKKNPVISLSAEEIKAFRIYESKLKIGELSNILKNMQGANAKLVVRGKNINLDSKPYVHDKVNNTILIPIKFLAEELGFFVRLDDNSIINGAKTLFIDGIVDGKTKSVKMDFGKEYCYVNGKFVKISSKLVIQQGRTYIPVDLMVEHFGLTFSFYNEGKNIQLIIN